MSFLDRTNDPAIAVPAVTSVSARQPETGHPGMLGT
jgi:hypothetical protein